jgi:hypothetical protein
MREPKLFFIDDGPGKAIGINMFIGKRPYAAFGNSGGDTQMLEWTQVRRWRAIDDARASRLMRRASTRMARPAVFQIRTSAFFPKP